VTRVSGIAVGGPPGSREAATSVCSQLKTAGHAGCGLPLTEIALRLQNLVRTLVLRGASNLARLLTQHIDTRPFIGAGVVAYSRGTWSQRALPGSLKDVGLAGLFVFLIYRLVEH
jgi:hypothetical protein